MKGIKFSANKGPHLFPRGDHYEMAKIHRRNFKMFFSRSAGPISTKLCTKNPSVKGIQFSANKGPHLFPREDNYEIAKIHRLNFKMFFSRTARLISTKLGTKHSLMKRIQVCCNAGQRPFPTEEYFEIVKVH